MLKLCIHVWNQWHDMKHVKAEFDKEMEAKKSKKTKTSAESAAAETGAEESKE